MIFYDYDMVGLMTTVPSCLSELEAQVDVVRNLLETKSRQGWRLVAVTPGDKIFIFERQSTNVELKKITHRDFDENGDEALKAEGWFFHSADSTGVNFSRKKT